MKLHGHFPGIPTVDTLMGLFLVVAVLLRLSLLETNINSGKASAERIKQNDLFDIKLQWASPDDMDLYCVDPLRHLVFFRRMADGLMVLDHDDTGNQSNMLTLPDGRQVKSYLDEENVTIKGIVAGEYVVNIHCYSKRGKEATPVTVTLFKITDVGDINVYNVALKFDHQGQEETAFRFTLTNDGTPVDINRLPHHFVAAAWDKFPGRVALRNGADALPGEDQ
jgi:hypothetical protein